VTPEKLPPPAAILWDWDNTLVDGWAAIAAGLNAAFAAFDLPRWTLEEVRARVRRSLRESFPEIFGAEWTRARDIFYAEVRARHLAMLAPMPEAEQALRAAARAGIPQAVVSNKQGPLLRAEAAADKPDPAPFRLALGACGAEGDARVWYVGDTALDMQAARASGLSAVLLGDARHDGGVANALPDAVFPDGRALAGWLSRLPRYPRIASDGTGAALPGRAPWA
jgi:phosphoglycolate phosphatase